MRNASITVFIRYILVGAALAMLLAGEAAAADAPPADPAPASAGASTVASGISAGRSSAEAAGAASPAPDDELQTVYVTARHRTENAQDVPISLSVLTSRALQSTGSFTLSDVEQQVPGLVAYDANPRNASIGIRGLGVTSAQDGMDTSVGVYLDGVYLGRPGMALEDLIDVDRVEVLRGPQGTLFGRNSSAGVVNITTNEPSFTPGATVEASFGDYAYNQERLVLTGPIVDGLAAFRVTAYNTYRDGTLTNTDTGGRDNGIERGGARTQLLLTPGNGVRVRFSADYAYEDDSANTDVVRVILPRSLTASVAQAQQALALAGWDPVASPSSAAVNSPQQMRTSQGGVSGRVDWDLGWGTFTSISAYRFWRFDPFQDSDDTPLDIYEVNVADTNDGQITQEMRFASNVGVLSWQTGVYFFDQDLHDHYILHQYGYDTGAYYTDYARLTNPAAPAVVVTPGSQYIDDVVSAARSAAAFGQANWKLTDALTLTGGLRYTYDRRTGTASSSIIGAVPLSLATPFAYDLEVVGHNLSRLGSLSYRLGQRTQLYASYSTGYKAAGLNLDSGSVPAGGLILKPETVTSYEVGIKQSSWGGRLALDADLYWTKLNDLQANFYPSNGAKSYLTNVGDIRARGAEVDASLAAGDLTVRASGAYSDAVYTSYPDAPCPVGVSGTCSLTGRPVFEAPRWSANGTVEYGFDARADVHPYALAQYSYTSGYFGTIDDSPYTRVSSYGIANVRLGLRAGRYDVSLWAHNLFDKRYFTSTALASINAPWGVVGQPGDPRTFGVSVRAEY